MSKDVNDPKLTVRSFFTEVYNKRNWNYVTEYFAQDVVAEGDG